MGVGNMCDTGFERNPQSFSSDCANECPKEQERIRAGKTRETSLSLSAVVCSLDIKIYSSVATIFLLCYFYYF